MHWAAIVPLIGGQVLGTRAALRSDPAFMLSYPDFAGNDGFIQRYLPHVPFHLLPEGLSAVRERWAGRLSLVVSTCPCAGLSLLSQHKVGSPQRAERNAWMLRTTELVLSELRPSALLGENAPQLVTNIGAEVRDGLVSLAERYGYTAQFVKVSTTMTGVPQHRERSFYYLTQGRRAPRLVWESQPLSPIESHLHLTVKAPTHPADEEHFVPRLENDPLYVFLREKYGEAWRNPTRSNTGYSDALQVFLRHRELFDEFVVRWPTPESYERSASFDRRQVQMIHRLHHRLKHVPGTGVYAKPPILPRGDGWYPAVTGKTAERLVHPREDRYLTYREVAHGLMGLPNDFALPSLRNWNVICQNVPTRTAAEATRALLPYLEGTGSYHAEEGAVSTDLLRGRETKYLSNTVAF